MSTPSTSVGAMARLTLRPFQDGDLPALVSFWNRAFSDRHNYVRLTAETFRRRILDCPAYGDGGLILAWHHVGSGKGSEPSPRLVGFVHAIKPPPRSGQYVKWTPEHHIAVLYVDPAFRRQGVGGRLLQAAENWLYYCPVHIGGNTLPCYGTIEGPKPPFFGSTERMSIATDEIELIRFYAGRGYAVHDAGDVSMTLDLAQVQPIQPTDIELERAGLRVQFVDNAHPFDGPEPVGRSEYALWGDNDGYPYAALIYVDNDGMLCGHISWYPLPSTAIIRVDAAPTDNLEPTTTGNKIALSHLWLSPNLRTLGIGAHLLDLGLHAMSRPNSNFNSVHAGGPGSIELHTHLVHNERAVALYESRGFQIDKAWVKLVKT